MQLKFYKPVTCRTTKYKQSSIPVITDLNNEAHLLVECPSVETVHHGSGLSTFLNLCKLKGMSDHQAFSSYVNGFDVDGNHVARYDYLVRGKVLRDITELFLNCW